MLVRRNNPALMDAASALQVPMRGRRRLNPPQAQQSRFFKSAPKNSDSQIKRGKLAKLAKLANFLANLNVAAPPNAATAVRLRPEDGKLSK
jgi:hypothetical protein